MVFDIKIFEFEALFVITVFVATDAHGPVAGDAGFDGLVFCDIFGFAAVRFEFAGDERTRADHRHLS